MKNLWNQTLVAVGMTAAFTCPVWAQGQSGGRNTPSGKSMGAPLGDTGAVDTSGKEKSLLDTPSPGTTRDPGTHSPAMSGSTKPDADMTTGTAGTAKPTSKEAIRQGKTSRTMSTADLTLQKSIRQALKTDTGLSVPARNVHVAVKSGAVTLRGTVQSTDEKAQVEAKVKEMTGVTKVKNRLQVASSTSASASGTGSAGASGTGSMKSEGTSGSPQ